jgi:hypothetical protein
MSGCASRDDHRRLAHAVSTREAYRLLYLLVSKLRFGHAIIGDEDNWSGDPGSRRVLIFVCPVLCLSQELDHGATGRRDDLALAGVAVVKTTRMNLRLSGSSR